MATAPPTANLCRSPRARHTEKPTGQLQSVSTPAGLGETQRATPRPPYTQREAARSGKLQEKPKPRGQRQLRSDRDPRGAPALQRVGKTRSGKLPGAGSSRRSRNPEGNGNSDVTEIPEGQRHIDESGRLAAGSCEGETPEGQHHRSKPEGNDHRPPRRRPQAKSISRGLQSRLTARDSKSRPDPISCPSGGREGSPGPVGPCSASSA